jgi:23S rRNA (uracil1939-C5)-methyltransferase
VLTSRQEIELTVEKPAAGGRMIARHDGQVVLVAGAIPGERVTARVERSERRVAFATVNQVLDASADRREGFTDASCGGCTYSHIAYSRQLALKGDIVRDTFLRIGRIPLDQPVTVAASPEGGYRMRARFHVHGTRVGFYREGTHVLCDPAVTGQLAEGSLNAVQIVVNALVEDANDVVSVELTEDIAGGQRALSAAIAGGRGNLSRAFERAVASTGLNGCTVRDATKRMGGVGEPYVADSLHALTGGRVGGIDLRRHAESFFQANRFLVPDLVGGVIDAVKGEGTVLDLYAGVGLFSVALAAQGRPVTAVEGDPSSGADLEHNAAALPSGSAALTVKVTSVEEHLAAAARPDTLVVDPPRTGISAEAMASVVTVRPAAIVYVSCDPATMARDARRLLDAGYQLTSLRAFDLFPNTPHIESLGVFEAT